MFLYNEMFFKIKWTKFASNNLIYFWKQLFSEQVRKG